MKITDVAFVFAATAAVTVNGEQCSNAKKCVRTCTLKGDPHLEDFTGAKSVLDPADDGWVDIYAQENGERVQVLITANGENQYVTGLKIGGEEFNTSKDCAKPMELEGANGVKVSFQCKKPKSGQHDKVENPDEDHFDLVLEKKYWENQGQGMESGACIGKDHHIDCFCAAPTASPTPQPTEASCEDQLSSKCGTEPEKCFVGKQDKACEDFIKCAADNGFSECYKPKEYSCIETLKRVCHREPKGGCYEGDSEDETPGCKEWIECAKAEQFTECYTPKTRKPTPVPTTQAPTPQPTTEAPTTQAPTPQPTTEAPTTQAPTTAKPSKAPTPQPTSSCKEQLLDKCGETPKNCFEGNDKKECVDFLKCVDDNDFHECYQPKEYTCEQKLKRVCGRKPKTVCYQDSENDDCRKYKECADNHGYSECYNPQPQQFKQLTCSSTCYAKGDPHVKTFFGDMYKTVDSAGKTISMINVDGFSVDATVDPVGDKEYITKATWGDEVMVADDCQGAEEREIKFENERGSVEGKVWCAQPKKSNLKGGSNWHLNVEIRQTFSVSAEVVQSGGFDAFVQAMGGTADTECMGTGDDASQDVTSWSGEKLANKFHCN